MFHQMKIQLAALALLALPLGCAGSEEEVDEGEDVTATSEDALNSSERAFLDRVTKDCYRKDYILLDNASDLSIYYYIDYQYQYTVGNRTYRVYKVYDAWYAGNTWLRVNQYPYFGVAHPRDCTGK